MRAIRTKFDGKKICIPKELRGSTAREVVLILPDPESNGHRDSNWLKAQESSFAKLWDNDEDAVYDSL